jgi:cytochrome c-type biogenesis protein CcmH
MKWLAVILALWAGMALAVQPDEVLDDPALEARARAISAGLRCPVCRNESIDESNADLARDIRLLVRDRLVAGDTDEAVIAAVVARYGEYALLRPDATGFNLILWLAGPVTLLAGLALAVALQRHRAGAEPASLTQAEQDRLDDILNS